jgi:hypothetical protein
MKSWHFALVALALGLGTITAAQQPQQRAEQRDMALVGYNDLQARSAYQPVIQKQGERWIAYIGHHGGVMPNPLTGKMESNGTSIVDVTNPKQPRYLAHVPGDEGQGEAGGAQMVRICNGSDLPRADKSKVYMLRTLGNVAHEIWDVTDGSKPSKVTTVVDGLKGTHKSWWECDTGIAYLVSGDPKWRTDRMTKIYDLGDPAKPVFIRDFGVPGQQPGATVVPVPTALHGPISLGPKGNRVYFGYGTGQAGIVQIIDRQRLLNGPKEPTEANLVYPQISRVDLPPDVGAHTAYPILGMQLPEFAKQKLPANPAIRSANGLDHDHASVGGAIEQAHRDMIAIVSETTGNECFEVRQLVRMLDVTTETRPLGSSTWTVPEASGNFCEKGGRFGAHSSQESFSPIYYKRVLFVAFFNAGLRALDIRDPYNMKEIAFFIPPITAKTDQRCVGGGRQGGEQRCKTAIQTNNVEVDDRGYIYIVDRANTGMHILELTGAARKVANFPGT